jgi:hypothetical protein
LLKKDDDEMTDSEELNDDSDDSDNDGVDNDDDDDDSDDSDDEEMDYLANIYETGNELGQLCEQIEANLVSLEQIYHRQLTDGMAAAEKVCAPPQILQFFFFVFF